MVPKFREIGSNLDKDFVISHRLNACIHVYKPFVDKLFVIETSITKFMKILFNKYFELYDVWHMHININNFHQHIGHYFIS